ncbi:g4966 [Coccomyxa elongata]
MNRACQVRAQCSLQLGEEPGPFWVDMAASHLEGPAPSHYNSVRAQRAAQGAGSSRGGRSSSRGRGGNGRRGGRSFSPAPSRQDGAARQVTVYTGNEWQTVPGKRKRRSAAATSHASSAAQQIISLTTAPTKTNEKSATILIDNSASHNFIARKFMHRHKIVPDSEEIDEVLLGDGKQVCSQGDAWCRSNAVHLNFEHQECVLQREGERCVLHAVHDVPEWRSGTAGKCTQARPHQPGVKHALTHAPIFRIPDYSQPFEVVCDASGYGLGAVLIHDGLPVAYKSRKMLPAEQNYLGEVCRVPMAKDFAGALHDKQQAAERLLAAAQSRQKAWADSHRSAKEFKPGYARDKFLSQQTCKKAAPNLARETPKLDPRRPLVGSPAKLGNARV